MQETESLDDRWDRRNEYVPVELPRHTVKIELHAVVPKGLHLAILYHPLFETRMDAGEPCGEILIDKTSCRIFVVSRFETVLVLFPQEVPEAVSMQVSDLLIESISPAKISVVSLIRSCHVISHNEATPGQVYFLSTNSKSSLECSEALPAPSLLQRVPASMLHAVRSWIYSCTHLLVCFQTN
jgi:hypothetical protein